MARKSPVNVFVTIAAFFLFLETGWGAQGVGQALDDAMKSRGTMTVEEVIQQFQAAVEQTENPAQKGNVLGLLSDFLIGKQEWEKSIAVNRKILKEGTALDRVGAYYNMAQAYLLLNQPEKAKAVCVELKAYNPDSTMKEFTRYMKEIAPVSVHAKLSEFLADTSLEPVTTNPEQIPDLSKPVESLPEPTVAESLASETPETKQPVVEKKTEEKRFEIGAKGWNSDLLGHIDAKGMNLDLNNDTDIGAQTKVALKGNWQFSKKDQLRLDYSQFDHDGLLSKAVTFDKIIYKANASVNVRTSFFDAGLSHLIDKSKHGSWKFLYGVKFSRSFTRLAQPTVAGRQAGELNQHFAVPYLGVEGNATLSPNVALNGSLKYFSLNQSEASGRLTDVDVALLFGRDYAKEPAETEWYGTLGYRFFLLHGEADNDSAEIRYSGPTFGLESRF